MEIDIINGAILTQGYCDLIYDWLQKTSGSYLEIGSYCGVFLYNLNIHYPNIKKYSIDPFIADGYTNEEKGTYLDTVYNSFLENTKEINNFTHWKYTTKELYDKGIYNKIEDLTCVLVDGSHHYEDVVIDLEFIKHAAKKQTYIVMDDYNISGVEKAIKEIPNIFGKKHITNLKIKNSCYNFIYTPYEP